MTPTPWLQLNTAFAPPLRAHDDCCIPPVCFHVVLGFAAKQTDQLLQFADIHKNGYADAVDIVSTATSDHDLSSEACCDHSTIVAAQGHTVSKV